VFFSSEIVYLKIVYSVCEIHNLAEFYKSAMLMQSQKAEFFQVGKRNIINQKIMDMWGNAKIALSFFLSVYEGCNFRLMNKIYKNFDAI